MLTFNSSLQNPLRRGLALALLLSLLLSGLVFASPSYAYSSDTDLMTIGDVDSDGDVDADDIQLVQDHILGISELPSEVLEQLDMNGVSTFDLVLMMDQPRSAVCRGDADGDGDVDADDVELIRDHILGISDLPPDVLEEVDMNGSGNISTFDIVLIIQQRCFPRQG